MLHRSAEESKLAHQVTQSIPTHENQISYLVTSVFCQCCVMGSDFHRINKGKPIIFPWLYTLRSPKILIPNICRKLLLRKYVIYLVKFQISTYIYKRYKSIKYSLPFLNIYTIFTTYISSNVKRNFTSQSQIIAHRYFYLKWFHIHIIFHLLYTLCVIKFVKRQMICVCIVIIQSNLLHIRITIIRDNAAEINEKIQFGRVKSLVSFVSCYIKNMVAILDNCAAPVYIYKWTNYLLSLNF